MKKIVVENYEYEILENNKECFNIDEFKNLYTDYFYDFDYILGDYSYGKLRLKGFYEKNNKKRTAYNDISKYKEYLNDFCAVECSYFLIKKQINVEKTK